MLNLGQDAPADGRLKGQIHNEINFGVESTVKELAQVQKSKEIDISNM
jgi:hypothetical protein